MSFNPVTVSNNVLRRAFDEDENVSPMKLQKLLYFIASDYAKATNHPLLNEPFQAWDYGPVVPSVYDEFRAFGGSPIRKFAKDATGKSKMVNESKDEALRASIDRIWDHAKGESAVRLSRITHREGSAWYNAFKLRRSGPIPDEALQLDTTYLEPLGLD